MVFGVISLNLRSKLYTTFKTIKAIDYIEILKEILLLFLKKVQEKHGGYRTIFQQDNARIYTARIV